MSSHRRSVSSNDISKLSKLSKLLSLFELELTNPPSLKRSQSAPNLLESIPFEMKNKNKFVNLKALLPLIFYTLGLFLYISSGVLYKLGQFNDGNSFNMVDALYFVSVSFTTTGYGDLVPNSSASRFFTMLFLVSGLIVYNVVVTGLMSSKKSILFKKYKLAKNHLKFEHYQTERFEKMRLIKKQKKFEMELNKHKMDLIRFKMGLEMFPQEQQQEQEPERFKNEHSNSKNAGSKLLKKSKASGRKKAALAFLLFTTCTVIGAMLAHFLEHMNWIDSLYFSICSVTSVGFGDFSFRTPIGRVCAVFWLLLCMFGVSKVSKYLRQLQGGCSQYDFIVQKLIDMGKLTEEEVLSLTYHYNANN